MTGLQEHFDTLSFPTEWTEISATLIPKCFGCRSLKDHRPLALFCAIRKLLGHVWMMTLPQQLLWRSCQAAFLPGRDASQAVFLVQRCCELLREWCRPLFCAQLDLRKAFDKAKHSAISNALLAKGASSSRGNLELSLVTEFHVVQAVSPSSGARCQGPLSEVPQRVLSRPL